MIWLIFLFLLLCVHASVFGSSYYEKIGFSVIILVNTSRCSYVSSSVEDELHELAHDLRNCKESAVLGVQHAISIAMKEYITLLQRVRAKSLDRVNVEKVVEEVTRGKVSRYIYSGVSAEMVKEAAQQANEESFETVSKDAVNREYIRCSRTALEACIGTVFDYRKFMRFPWSKIDDCVPASLKIIVDFITTTFVKHEYDATYPDAVMCLSALQNLKYLALCKSQMKFLKSITLQYVAVLDILKNLTFKTRRRKKHF